MDEGMFNVLMKEYEKAYFPDEHKISGIPIKNDISRVDEDFIVNNYLRSGTINEIIVAWKAGRLKKVNDNLVPEENDEGDYLNGYGKPINKEELKEYLNRVSYNWSEQNLQEIEVFKDIYDSIITSVPDIPDNFGAVYIINLVFFLSKGNWPIYDKFAHKALKAIAMKTHPYKVYVGDAPLKTTGKQRKPNIEVVNMYSEYMWLLDMLFGKHSFGTDRTIDRALWVYGHATDEYIG